MATTNHVYPRRGEALPAWLHESFDKAPTIKFHRLEDKNITHKNSALAAGAPWMVT